MHKTVCDKYAEDFFKTLSVDVLMNVKNLMRNCFEFCELMYAHCCDDHIESDFLVAYPFYPHSIRGNADRPIRGKDDTLFFLDFLEEYLSEGSGRNCQIMLLDYEESSTLFRLRIRVFQAGR